jgi:amidophosphoribosyltransferase
MMQWVNSELSAERGRREIFRMLYQLHMCGIVGLIGTPEAAREAFLGLTTLQHRGQDAAGILSYDHTGFHRVKNLGLVESVFTRENISSLTGQVAIGHARYSTIGRGDLVDVQPFLLSYPFGLGMVHNGNIVNCEELAKDLKTRGRRHLLTQSDTEVILNLFAEGLAKSPLSEDDSSDVNFDRICSSVGEIFTRVNGSYSIATLIADQGLVAFRDPLGIRPLIWGKKKNESGGFAHMVASESVALSFLGYEIVRDIQPGEVILIDMNGKVYSRVLTSKSSRHCMFEWVYFSSPESVMDGTPVYRARIDLGRSLGELIKKQIVERKIEADLVVPVPETSRIAAIALAEVLGIPYREVLIKNRYIKRTFILDSQEKRQKAVNLKLSPVRSEIEGKRVLLVDDSIVRGTTSRKIIELVRNAGASKVYFVSTCPPIQYPCYYGIDFPIQSELIASGKDLEAIEKDLGADAVIYQNLAGLEKAITGSKPSFSDRRPCMACLDGRYPTDISFGSRFASARKADRKEIM